MRIVERFQEVKSIYEYLKTGGPDESCFFDVYQIKCLPNPITDECPPGFGQNEDDRCFPMQWRMEMS